MKAFVGDHSIRTPVHALLTCDFGLQILKVPRLWTLIFSSFHSFSTGFKLFLIPPLFSHMKFVSTMCSHHHVPTSRLHCWCVLSSKHGPSSERASTCCFFSRGVLHTGHDDAQCITCCFLWNHCTCLIPAFSEALHRWSSTLLIILLAAVSEILRGAPGRGRFMVKWWNQCQHYILQQEGCERLKTLPIVRCSLCGHITSCLSLFVLVSLYVWVSWVVTNIWWRFHVNNTFRKMFAETNGDDTSCSRCNCL